MRKKIFAVATALTMLFAVGAPGAANAAPVASRQATKVGSAHAALPVACKTNPRRSVFGATIWQASPRKKVGTFVLYFSTTCKSVWGVLEGLTRYSRGKKFTVRTALYANAEARWLGNVPAVVKLIGSNTKFVAGRAMTTVAGGGPSQCVYASVAASGVLGAREGCMVPSTHVD